MAGSRALVGMAAVLLVVVSGCGQGGQDGQDGTVDTELDLLVWVRQSGSDAAWTPLPPTPGPVTVAPGQELSLQASSPSGFGDAELGQLAADFAGANLTNLNLSGTAVTDTGLTHLAGLTNLTWLNLGSCADVTDAGLVHIAGLTDLTWLNLGACTDVTDAGLVHIAGLANLTDLDLHSTGVTDAGLTHLEGLTNLERLDLSFTDVTDAGVAALEEKLPGCNILHFHVALGERSLPYPGESPSGPLAA